MGMADGKKDTKPPQTQPQQPGRESEMTPKPQSDKPSHRGSGKLEGRVGIITGGDSGIGRAVAVAFAKEGADVVIGYLNEHDDAKETVRLVEQEGRRAKAFAGDIGDESYARNLVDQTVREFGKVDIVVNNAAEQHDQEDFENITAEQLQRTFKTNIFGMFYLTRAALPHLKEGSAIVNTTSVTAYRGSEHLIDYASTKGAIVGFTRSLSKNLAKKKIRVNAVAPGPIWTPLIPATFPKEKVESFGKDVPLGRPGEPSEVAPCYVFLASDDSSYMTGQVLHPNGGEIING
jgi:NAD(P)-dependent dehydrogenase (short-subunit alcohol dehydrogenase family)